MAFARATITVEHNGASFEVMFNPEEYTLNRDNNFASQAVPGLSSPILQFAHGNLRTLESYPNLSGYMRDLYQVPGVGDTVRLDQIKQHYYITQDQINPTRIVPMGPLLDFSRPHGREQLS